MEPEEYDLNPAEAQPESPESVPAPTPADLRPARKIFSRLGLALFAIAAVTTSLQAVCAGLLTSLPVPAWLSVDNWGMWLVSFVPLYCVAVPVGLLLFRKIPAEKPEDQKLSAGSFFRLLLICFPLMYAGNLIGTFLSLLLSGGQAQNALYSFIQTDSPVKIVVIVFLAPVIEEFVFRKKLIDRARRYGEKSAMVLSALTFGLFHMNLYQFFYAFALGLVFAYVYTRTGRLRYSVVMHMVINFLGSVVAPYLAGSLDLSSLQSAGMDPEKLMTQFAGQLPQLMALGIYGLAILGLSVAGLVILIVYAKKAVFRPAPEELPKEKRVKTIYGNVGMLLFIVLCLTATAVALFAS
jgi:membrane protease YdiL (CAAX protease family)